MRLYMDTCCLNRRFDKQDQDRVRLEAEAVANILERVRAGQHLLLSSDVLRDEILQTGDAERRSAVMHSVGNLAGETVILTSGIRRRADDLQLMGFRDADALHLASAEAGAADFLLSVDDRLVARARRHRSSLGVPVVNPLDWERENPHDDNGIRNGPGPA